MPTQYFNANHDGFTLLTVQGVRIGNHVTLDNSKAQLPDVNITLENIDGELFERIGTRFTDNMSFRLKVEPGSFDGYSFPIESKVRAWDHEHIPLEEYSDRYIEGIIIGETKGDRFIIKVTKDTTGLDRTEVWTAKYAFLGEFPNRIEAI